jgi:hypothetical protein
MTERNWRTMSDEEFADWFRNLKLKALEATEDERTRQACAVYERASKLAEREASADPITRFKLKVQEEIRSAWIEYLRATGDPRARGAESARDALAAIRGKRRLTF